MYNSANLIISILFNFNNQMQMMPLLIIDPDLYNMYIGIRGGFFFSSLDPILKSLLKSLG